VTKKVKPTKETLEPLASQVGHGPDQLESGEVPEPVTAESESITTGAMLEEPIPASGDAPIPASGGESKPLEDVTHASSQTDDHHLETPSQTQSESEAPVLLETQHLPGYSRSQTPENVETLPVKVSDSLDGVFLPEEEYPSQAANAVVNRTDNPTLELPPYDPQKSGELEEITETPTFTPPDHAETIKLERGEYAVSGKDAFGRSLATGPDGAEVLIVSYRGGPDVTRALYPHPMLPALLDAGLDLQGLTLIAHPRITGHTLEAAMRDHDLSAVGQVMVDLARFNRYLVARGFALVGLEPRDILTEPTRFARLPAVRRIGEDAPAEAPRYASPERTAGRPIKGDEGAYTLGALLYHAITGQPIPEGETTPNDLPARPGVPQALSALLSPPPGRASPGEALELLTHLASSLGTRQRWRVAGASSVGLNPDRPMNEDACGWRLEAALGHIGQERRVIACVSDGMGGMARGEIASTAAVERFMETKLEPGVVPSADLVRERVMDANRRVTEALEGKAGGCTFTGLIADGRNAYIGHVGDTRAYHVSSAGKTVTQITEDHSMVAMLVKMGVIDAASAHGHPDSNKVTRALGSNREIPASYVDIYTVSLQTGDHLILVSDGVWGALEPDAFNQIVQEGQGVQDTADKLVREALNAGSSDNTTAVVLEYEEREPL
jgi:serine/threonine protein phosphatase PrpC